jgi:putative ABC transport system permease protein
MLCKLAWQSLLHRRTTALLTTFSIAIGIMIMLSIHHIQQQAKQGFTNTLSDTDLIVGARSGSINLLLYSVFRIGSANNNISWDSYQTVKRHKNVRWTIPLSLGDSHQGYRVIGTNGDYFTYYRYGQKQALTFLQGQPFSGVYDAVLGAEVAKKLGYTLQQKIVLSHGVAKVSFTQHDDKPFTVVGILEATGTPVDQSIHISLAGMEAVHIDWQRGAPVSGLRISAEEALQKDLTPKNITAFLVGLDNKMMTFRLQRAINDYPKEALMAVLPGVVLSELWQIMDGVEKALAFIALLVIIASLLGMVTMMLSTLQQRQRELAVLRAIGAPPWFMFCLIQLEVLLLTLAGLMVGTLLLWLGIAVAQPIIQDQYGLLIDSNPISYTSLLYGGGVLAVSLIMACIPAFAAYRQSLGQGLTAKD